MWKRAALIIITLVFVGGLYMVYDGIYKPSKELQNKTQKILDKTEKAVDKANKAIDIGKIAKEKLTKENIEKAKKKTHNLLEAGKAALKSGKEKYKSLEEDSSEEVVFE